MRSININHSSKHFAQEYGFTLIEILISSAILVILAFGFLGLQYIIGRNQVSVWKSYLSIEDANQAISAMSRELRSARQNDAGEYLLETANDNEIIFYSDSDYDEAVERVRYTLTDNKLIKGTIEPVGSPAVYPLESEKVQVVSEIIRNGTNPTFYYYNSNWPEDTTNNPLQQDSRISDTAEVKIVVRTNPDNSNPKYDYTLESNVRLRMIF